MDDYESPRDLARMYFYDMKQPDKAYEVLKKAIYADGKVDFQDFFCIFDLVQYYCLDKNETELRKYLAKIETISIQDDEKKYSASRLRGFATLLASLGAMDVSAAFTKTAYRLHPSDDIKFSNDFITQMNQVEQSTAYCDKFKMMIHETGKLFYDGIEKTEQDEFYRLLSKVMDCLPDNQIIKENINAMKINHPVVYEANAKYFDKLLNITPYKYLNDCPHCKKPVSVTIYSLGRYTCPHCKNNFYYSITADFKNHYSIYAASSSIQAFTSSSKDNYWWILCIIVAIVIFAALGQCG